jgi:hypothetical protein
MATSWLLASPGQRKSGASREACDSAFAALYTLQLDSRLPAFVQLARRPRIPAGHCRCGRAAQNAGFSHASASHAVSGTLSA